MSAEIIEKMPMGSKSTAGGTVANAATNPPTNAGNINVPISAGGIQVAFANPRRISLAIYNVGPSNTIYLGKDANVTTANGFPVPAGTSYLDTESTDTWFAIAATAACDVRLLEVSNNLQAG